jgi:hypothetical protein
MSDPKPAKRYKVDTDGPPSRCKSCGSKVWWIATFKGKRVAVNRDGTSHECLQDAKVKEEPVASLELRRGVGDGYILRWGTMVIRVSREDWDTLVAQSMKIDEERKR